MYIYHIILYSIYIYICFLNRIHVYIRIYIIQIASSQAPHPAALMQASEWRIENRKSKPCVEKSCPEAEVVGLDSHCCWRGRRCCGCRRSYDGRWKWQLLYCFCCCYFSSCSSVLIIWQTRLIVAPTAKPLIPITLLRSFRDQAPQIRNAVPSSLLTCAGQPGGFKCPGPELQAQTQSQTLSPSVSLSLFVYLSIPKHGEAFCHGGGFREIVP